MSARRVRRGRAWRRGGGLRGWGGGRPGCPALRWGALSFVSREAPAGLGALSASCIPGPEATARAGLSLRQADLCFPSPPPSLLCPLRSGHGDAPGGGHPLGWPPLRGTYVPRKHRAGGGPLSSPHEGRRRLPPQRKRAAPPSPLPAVPRARLGFPNLHEYLELQEEDGRLWAAGRGGHFRTPHSGERWPVCLAPVPPAILPTETTRPRPGPPRLPVPPPPAFLCQASCRTPNRGPRVGRS